MRKQSLLIKTFLSFALFFIFTLGISLAIFNYSMINYSENAIGDSNISKLKVLRGVYDILIYSANQQALNLSQDAELNVLNDALKSSPNVNSSEIVLEMKSIMEKLGNIIDSNEWLQSVYIYSKNNDYLISSKTGVYKINEFYDTSWLKYYNKSKINPFWMKNRIPINADILKNPDQVNVLQLDTNNVITYVYPLTSYTTKLVGAIIINVKVSNLNALINANNLGNGGSVFITDRNGEIINDIDPKLESKMSLNLAYAREMINEGNDSGYVIKDLDHKKQLITYCRSDLNDWYYLGMYPLNSLTNKVNTTRDFIFVTILMLMIAGVFVYYIATKRLFSPVYDLIQNIKKQKGITLNETDNEFAKLSKAFDYIIKNERALSDSFEKNKKNIRYSYLLNILNGNIEEKDDSMIFEDLFPYENFFCVILSIDKYVELKKVFFDEQRYYVKTLILNICEQIFSETFKCCGLILEKDKIAFIMNSAIPEYHMNLEELTNKINLIYVELSKVLDFTVSFGIGNKYSGKKELTNSYLEAQEAIKYKFVLGYNRIIKYNDVSSRISENYFPDSFEEHIINNLNSLSKEGIVLEIDTIITKIKTESNLSYDNVILIFTQITGITIRHLLNLNVSIRDIFGDDFNIYNRLNENETIDEMGKWLSATFISIIDYLSTMKSSGEKYIDSILSYINENYKKDIDVNLLAENIGISYTHLRRLFVNVTGENLVSYINNLRITEAKRLLKETDTSIMSIALGLGYNNDQSFNRYFKKYEGITPGEYRKSKKILITKESDPTNQ